MSIHGMPSSQRTNSAQARASQPTSTTTPRKRRKRTVGSGAADDCFTCANRGIKCDRRRPYCSQCLDRGQDCSGYKTTLTWGVGVASRGKLRGLSLPISGGKPVALQKDRKQGAIENASKPLHRQNTQSSHMAALEEIDSTSAPTAASTRQRIDSVFNTQCSFSSGNAQGGEGWAAKVPYSHEILEPSFYYVDGSSPIYSAYNGGYTPAPQAIGVEDDGIASSLARALMPDSEAAMQASYAGISIVSKDSVAQPWSHMASPLEFDQIGHDSKIKQLEETYGGYGKPSELATSLNSPSPLFFRNPFATSLPCLLIEQSVGRTPRMRYLISYFVEAISPVIVAFDSPTNPYRTQILRLAGESETLQHAIAALSSSNLRQRRESRILSTERTFPARMSSLAHKALTDTSFQRQYGISEPKDSPSEELYHKAMAIKSLNARLADPVRRHEDSVLATLLILCLFHICQTGVARFQTQFAGVQKLLTMKSRGTGVYSEEARWCTRMFTWLDAISATINDREGQLHGPFLDMITFCDEEWGLENLAGCDSQLFRLIARLGHLNVLSQNKPMQRQPLSDPPMAIPIVPPSISSFTPFPGIPGMAGNDSFLLSPDVELPDQTLRAEFWTEWHSLRQGLESWRLDTSSVCADTSTSSPSPPNSCESLSTSGTSAVTFDSSPASQAPHCFVSLSNLADLSNTSEAFRYAALLYTDRLAFPHLLSSHPRIQYLVLLALGFISAVQSDVYLLWPLFITGTECVYEEHRNLIRRRCRDIQKDSGFYNNISCLELLEKIWARNPSEMETPHASSSTPTVCGCASDIFNNHLSGNCSFDHMERQWNMHAAASENISPASEPGFKWRSIIENENLDGEYIVV